jgi:diguanylate cyclase (GGDEF)-like protein
MPPPLPKLEPTLLRIALPGILVVPLGALVLEGLLTLADRTFGAVTGSATRETAFFALILLAVYVAAVYAGLSRSRRRESHELRSLIEASNTDHVTGVMARTPFIERMRDVVRRSKAQKVLFLQVDLDYLKQINDAYGHATGDQVLAHLAATLRRLWPDALIGRIGGDEFGVLLSDAGEIAAVEATLATLQVQLTETISVNGRSIRVSASVGYSASPGDSPIPSELMALADLALYEAKKTRGVAVPFRAELLVDARARRFLVRELKAAILLDQLEVHYQPVVGIDGITRTGFEALVRWRHPVRGLISPERFIPVAEGSTLIDDLGEWVLRRVVRDFPRLGVPRAGVNVSPVQLRSPGFAQRFLSIIEEGGLVPGDIVVELTESCLLSPGLYERTNLDLLKAAGIRLALDDFGTGYASLQYLREFKADYIKLDKSYVQGAVDNPVELVFVTAILSIARSLDLVILAEGVETRAQFDLMTDVGCTLFQGYLTGRPAPLSTWSDDPASDAGDERQRA